MSSNQQIKRKASDFFLFRFIISGWDKLVNIGVDDGVSDFDKKRIRLINGICSWAFSIYFIYVLVYISEQKLQVVFFESVAGVIGYLLPIFLNYRRRYNLACHFFNIFNLFFYLEQTLVGGQPIGVEYIFVPSCVTALLFFRSQSVVFLYFLANALFFGIAKYSFGHFKPFFRYDEEAHGIYIANHITMFLILFLIVYYFRAENNRQEKLLESRNINLSQEKQKLEKALTELKAAQDQLIQSEKMASLGELTAGIAHEIQNPLNFVNNFSDISNELIDEMNEELSNGRLEEAKTIANDIKQNLDKINHHGRRADAIVKGMLQHSRKSSLQKEPTDINALADEFLRLAYHGLRAKDKSFNATLQTDYDAGISKINIYPQDIGRVILNIINNAFYAVSEKLKTERTTLNADGKSYEPTVPVTTKKLNDKIEIQVTDNGNGIPKKIVDKIFQPFFTTKPTGQGTGLGLSLSYDIVKAHGGEIKVNTKEAEGTEFIIVLPVV